VVDGASYDLAGAPNPVDDFIYGYRGGVQIYAQALDGDSIEKTLTLNWSNVDKVVFDLGSYANTAYIDDIQVRTPSLVDLSPVSP
jgi:hypothetical protein